MPVLMKLLVAVLCVFAVGCAKVRSVDVATENLFVTISVSETEGDHEPGIQVSASLVKAPEEGDERLTVVELSGGEVLEVDAFDETRILPKNLGEVSPVLADVLGMLIYGTVFPHTNNEHALTFRLKRASGEVLEASVGLPSVFELLSPTSEDVFSVSENDIEFVWQPVGSEEGVNTELDFRITSGDEACFESYIKEIIADTGSHIVPAGSLQLSEGVESCTVKVRVLATDKAYFGNNEESSVTATRPLVVNSLTLIP